MSSSSLCTLVTNYIDMVLEVPSKLGLRKNRRVVVANVSKSNPLGESQTGAASVSVSKEGVNSDSGSVVGKDIRILETGFEVKVDNDGNGGGDVLGGSGNGSFSSGGGGGGGGGGDGGDDNGDDKEEDEFGPILKFEEVMNETEARGVSLPSDMLEAAKSVGIRKLLLLRYLGLQKYNCAISANFYLGVDGVINSVVQDVVLDHSYVNLIVIDSCCATFAEVQKRGKDFWAEFELYDADLLVGVVVNVALVGMLAPYAYIGGPSVSKGFLGRMQHAYGALPSSVFEAERPGCRFTVKRRIGYSVWNSWLSMWHYWPRDCKFDHDCQAVLSSDNPKFGYNAATGDYEDLMTAGVIVEIKEPEPMPAGNPMDNSGYGFNLSFSARLGNLIGVTNLTSKANVAGEDNLTFENDLTIEVNLTGDGDLALKGGLASEINLIDEVDFAYKGNLSLEGDLASKVDLTNKVNLVSEGDLTPGGDLASEANLTDDANLVKDQN
ncbi:hypothetical protein SO802_012529 [Lithocarpus litseifolius]|uniref:Uncharacterized protein n=1 Tax=Lithocarpus litseifolius TaxID=425828 RepID=A0AAW2D2Z5_9ROSI